MIKGFLFDIFRHGLRFISVIIKLFVKTDDRLILICVGKFFNENQKALIEYVENEYIGDKRIVLFTSIQHLEYSKIECVKSLSLKGLIYFIKAKILVISFGQSDFKPFVKLKSQISVNIWHGIPLKLIGFYIGYLKVDWDYHIVSSEFEKEVMMSSYKLKGEQVKVLGVPKNDKLFETKKNLRTNQVLYLNTFREYENSAFFAFEDRNLEQLNNFLINENLVIIIKLHPNDFNNPNLKELENLSQIQIAQPDFDIQIELKKSLGLITDYSGIVFDALGADLPIVLVPYDLDKYQDERGFNRDYSGFLTNNQISSQKELIRMMLKMKENNGIEEHITEKNTYYKYQDQNSSKRIINFISAIS